MKILKRRQAMILATGIAVMAMDKHRATQPGRLQSSRLRTANIEMRVIAHMQHLMGRHASEFAGTGKDARIGLRTTQGCGIDRTLKELAKTHPMHVCVAIGERNQPIAGGPFLQYRSNIVKALHLLARGQKHLEGILGQVQ